MFAKCLSVSCTLRTSFELKQKVNVTCKYIFASFSWWCFKFCSIF